MRAWETPRDWRGHFRSERDDEDVDDDEPPPAPSFYRNFGLFGLVLESFYFFIFLFKKKLISTCTWWFVRVWTGQVPPGGLVRHQVPPVGLDDLNMIWWFRKKKFKNDSRPMWRASSERLRFSSEKNDERARVSFTQRPLASWLLVAVARFVFFISRARSQFLSAAVYLDCDGRLRGGRGPGACHPSSSDDIFTLAALKKKNKFFFFFSEQEKIFVKYSETWRAGHSGRSYLKTVT